MTVRLLVGIAIGFCGWWLWPYAQADPPALPHPFLHHDEVITKADYQSLARFHQRVTPEDVARALAMINPYGTLGPYTHGDVNAWRLFGSPQRLDELAKVEWQPTARQEASIPVARGLAGLRILLDPGHFGGAFSATERRHFVVKNREPVREGDLNWGTALVLQQKLQAAGAQVILARGPPPESPFPELDPAASVLDSDAAMLAWLEEHLGGFQTVAWLREHPPRLTRFRIAVAGALRAPQFAPDRSLHHVFARYDYRRRGLMSAVVNADLLLSLHHNISGRSWVNRLVVFVPGFVRFDADNEPGRFFAFRRTLEGDMPMLVQLAYDISQEMQEELEVPADQYVKRADLNKLPLFPGDGVFARNLGVLRRATGPALLIEGPCMNHLAENKKLLQKDFVLSGRAYPNRVKQYARAVFRALLKNAEALQRHRQRRRITGAPNKTINP